jgi:DNA polymerase-3 subunit alpha
LNDIEELLVKPDGFEIKNSHIHGITHQHADLNGIAISNALEIFAKFIDESDYIIGYNIFFDINIMLNELYRLGMSKTIDKILQLKAEQKILCTGALSQKYI